MPFKKGHKVEPHWHRPVGAENGLSTEAVSRTRLCTIRRNITTWCRRPLALSKSSHSNSYYFTMNDRAAGAGPIYF